MLKKLFLSLTILLAQILPIQEAHATAGYTSWNDYVSKLEGCSIERTSCDNFAEGQKVYMIGYSVCTYSGNTCLSVTNYRKISNNPYALLDILKNSINTIYSITQGFEFEYVVNEINQYGLNYGTYKNTSEGRIFAGGGIIPVLDIPLCSGFLKGVGCPNQKNDQDPLDRTKIKDSPCEICSKLGNPFDVRNGAKTEYATDLEFPLSVQRIYNSKLHNVGMFGVNWRSNYDKKVIIQKFEENIITLSFITPDDQNIIYTLNESGSLTQAYNDTSQYKMKILNGSIILTRPDSGVEYYDLITGRITAEVYKGKILNYQYNSNGLLYRVSSDSGKYLQFYFSGYANVVEQITASNGDILQYNYSNGNVSSVSFNNINQISYEYSGLLLTGKLNGAGVKYASFSYDEQGRGIENKWITNDGHEIKKYNFSYGNGQTIVTQNNGFSRTYSMSDYNYQKRIDTLNWNGFTEQNSFDSAGNVSLKKEFNGTYQYYTNDSAGRIINYTRDGKQVSLTWDTEKNILISSVESSPNGTRTTSYTYDAYLNVLSKTIVGNGETMVWNYSWAGDKITSSTSPDGLVTTYTYNGVDSSPASGLLNSITTNSGKSMTVNSYDVRGNPTSITVNGITKTMSYDYKGRILSESTTGITNNYTYDINGNMLTAQMASGYSLSMTYDSAGRLLSIQDNMGGNATFGIDDYTNEVLSTSISQNNSLVRARNKILDSLGRTTQSWNATVRTKQTTNYYSYIDKPNSTTDANGKQSNYGWDSKDNMTYYSGGGDSSMQSYDIDSNQTSVSVNNQTTNMSYDDFGRIVQLTSADTGTHSYAYSTANRTVSHTDAKGIVHSSSSDLNGNPLSISHTGSGSSQSESYSYNNNGELTNITDNSGSTTYNRNNLGQVTSKTQTIGSKSFTVQYGYNNIGQKISETYPSGLVISYSYNNGFLSSINAGGNNIVSNIQYNSMLKEVTSWNLGGNNVSVNKDSDGLLTSFVESGVFNQSITTDNEGHIISLTDNVSNNNFNVILTDNYAIQSGTINNSNLNYYFASNNNLYSQTDGKANYEFNPAYNHNKVSNFHDQTYNYYYYQYDANGNTMVDNKGNYTYDLKNNMISSTRSYTVNGQQVNKVGNYNFNALGHRVMKTVSGQSRYFVYNENNQLIGEYDNAGNIINEYVYFGLRPVAVKTGNNLNIVHTDYLGTPRVITSGTSGGSMIWQWKNDNPYGNNEATGSIEFNLRFTGQYYDSESGLHYNIHRTYNPEVGRYMQSDPIGLAGGSNTYNYVNRNPLDAVDPLGLEGISGTNNSILSGAIHNSASIPIGSLGITMHSRTYLLNNNITVSIESGSELYNLAKIKNPKLKIFQENSDLILTAEGLADLLNKTLDMSKYDSIYLMSCNLGNKDYIDEYSKDIFSQTFSNSIKKKTFAYSAYIVGEKRNNEYYFSGYYTNPYSYQAQYLNLNFINSTYIESKNATAVKKEFNPR